MTRSNRTQVAAALVAFSLASTPPRCAFAGASPSAAEEFRAGTEAFERGEFAKAAARFEAAFHKSPKGAAAYNAAVAWEAAGELPRAADDYALALSRKELAQDQRADAESKSQALAKRLATVAVTAPDGALVTIEHVERAKPPVRVHVVPGAHDVRVELASGRTLVRHVSCVAAATLVLTVDDATPEVEPAGNGGAAHDAPPTAERRDATDAAAPSASALPWLAVGGGAALVGVGAYLGLEGLSARDEFVASGDTDAGAHDRAVSLRTWANVAIVAGVAAGATGAVLLLTRKPASNASASVQFGPTGLALRGTF